MSKYLKGSKRLAIIQRWLQGIDDPNYDVLPTKKEGKYIVKKRTAPMKNTTEQDEQQQADDEDEHEVEQQQDEQQSEQDEQQESPQPQPQAKLECVTHPKPKSPVRKLPPQRKAIQRNRISQQPQVDSTVNLEILEQLKLLGDEIRTKRERKEQKQLIKHVVQKQLRTSPMNESHVIAKSKPVEEYEYYSDDDEQPVVFKSRIFH